MSNDKITEQLTTADDVVRDFHAARKHVMDVEDRVKLARARLEDSEKALIRASDAMRKASNAVLRHFSP